MITGHGGLAELIRARIGAGRLPRERPEKMWVGPGLNKVCDACDFPITADQQEYEFDPPGWPTIRLHRDCLDIWEAERVKLGSIHGGSSGVVETSALRIGALFRHGSACGYCIECLASRFEISLHETREAAQVLVTRPGFRMVERDCYTCGRMKDVLVFVAVPPTRG